MLRMREEVCRGSGAALVHLRETTAGAVRPAPCRGHVYSANAERPAANAVALRGSAAGRSSGFTGGGPDAPGSCETAGRGDALRDEIPRKSLRERRRAESDWVV